MKSLLATLAVCGMCCVVVVSAGAAAEGERKTPVSARAAAEAEPKTPEQILVAKFEAEAKTTGNTAVAGGIKWIKDIAYRKDGSDKQKLDVVMPENLGDRPRPGIVVVHGGGWRGGDKGRARFTGLAMRLAGQGFVCINVNYRLTGEAPYPAAFEDVKCAVRWFRANAKRFNVDPKRVGAVGVSAGAHLVALLGLAACEPGLGSDSPYSEYSAEVQAVAAMCTPSDFVAFVGGNGLRAKSSVVSFLGGPGKKLAELARQASPITYVKKDAPAFLLVHGTADAVVPVAQSDAFSKALRDAGADVTYIRIPGQSHSVYEDKKTRPAIDAFFARTLKGATKKSKSNLQSTRQPKKQGSASLLKEANTKGNN